MPDQMTSYWELIEPLFLTIDTGNSPKEFTDSISDVERPKLLLFAAHMCLAEVHNGGFLQLFWNGTGILVPEGEEGFRTVGMPSMAALLQNAALKLGSPYPRDRDDRWDALLVASMRQTKELKHIFKKQENLDLAFVEATSTLDLDALDKQFLEIAKIENDGFQNAATRYANSVHLVH